MGFFYFILSCAFLSSSVAVPIGLPEADLKPLAESGDWQGLLQYQRGWTGSIESEVDGDSFFLSEHGKADPYRELLSTLDAFTRPVPADPDVHAICRFPARMEFLKRKIQSPRYWEALPHPDCKNLKSYLGRIQNRKVSVVFTSYHPGNASSVFGHTFLKFSGDNENELFDTGINFAANPTTSNPALYAFYGLVGVFPSTFSALPFYYKVREYNDSESRDLWLYELNLSREQIDRLILHLWELGNTHFSYFYFNENCSYQILRGIEGALPEIRFFNQRPIYLIPSESIKAIQGVDGLIRTVRYRPSILRVAQQGFESLDPARQREFKTHMTSNESPPQDPAVLDVLIDTIDLKKDPGLQGRKEAILEKRSKTEGPGASRQVSEPVHERPDLGHGSRRLRFGQEWSRLGPDTRWNTLIQARAAHHDLMDPTLGYPRHLHIDFGRVGLRIQPEHKRLFLEELTLVELTALHPYHPVDQGWSYSISVGYHRRWTRDCSNAIDCPRVSVRGAIGKTAVFLKKQTIYTMLQMEPGYGTSFLNSKWKWELAPLAGLIWEWLPEWKSRFEAYSRYDFTVSAPWTHGARLENRWVFGNRFGLEFNFQREFQTDRSRDSVGLNGLYYF